MMIDRENAPIVAYGPYEGSYHAYFRVCPKCGRFVKAFEYCRIPEYAQGEPNANCRKCEDVRMPFATWLEEEDFEGE